MRRKKTRKLTPMKSAKPKAICPIVTRISFDPSIGFLSINVIVYISSGYEKYPIIVINVYTVKIIKIDLNRIFVNLYEVDFCVYEQIGTIVY